MAIDPKELWETPDKLLNEFEFSSATGIPVETLRDMRKPTETEGVPYIKLGRSVRYTLRQYLKFIDSKTVDPRRIRR